INIDDAKKVDKALEVSQLLGNNIKELAQDISFIKNQILNQDQIHSKRVDTSEIHAVKVDPNKYQNPCKKCEERLNNTSKLENNVCWIAPEHMMKIDVNCAR
ncbi:23093_t:CDS:2, partial [Dentiscutata erythropus]